MAATPPEPLAPVFGLTRAGSANPDLVHARAPRNDWMTCCGRSITRWTAPPTTPVSCRDCRQVVALVEDRKKRGLTELCLMWNRQRWARSKFVLCRQPMTNHRLRPDLSYDHPWHDDVELPPDWEDADEPAPAT